MKVEINLDEHQKTQVVLTTLQQDLKIVQEAYKDYICNVDCNLDVEYNNQQVKQCKKDIKMLKKAINFYSVSPPYDNV